MQTKARQHLWRPWQWLTCRAGQWRCAWLAVLALAAGPACANSDEYITNAEFAEPTAAYDHAILGDALEWRALILTVHGQGAAAHPRTIRINLPKTRVFEDISPRLLDVDGDQNPEVIVVETHLAKGARLSIYGTTGLIAATPYIGRPHRWLAPVGAADLDGDGIIEIAYIDRPHLAKTLRIWQLQDDRMVQIAQAPGMTNHKIGWDFIPGGIRNCGHGPEIIVASGNWQQVLSVRLQQGEIIQQAIGTYTEPNSLNTALRCQ